MKLISWNVNGIRANIRKGFVDFVKKSKPDILCLQETRGYPENIDQLLPNYKKFWNHAEKKGYSGTAIFINEKLISNLVGVKNGMGKKKHDQEGRVLIAEYANFYLLSVYTPNSGDELRRLEYRMEWDRAFLSFLIKLDKKKPVIFCGDLNVAHKEIDLKHPNANRRSAGFTDEERAGFSKILNSGFVDSFRHFYPHKKDQYTWWSYRSRARERNIGWRIDYFGLSQRMISEVKKAFIMPQVMGSDHCPVGIEI